MSTASPPRVLLTNFHPHGGGGHVTFIRAVLESHLGREFQFGVASPPDSRALAVARELGVPAFPCWFPGNIKEIPDVIRAMGVFRRVCGEFAPAIVHCNGGRDHSIVAWRRWWDKSGEAIVRTHHAIRQIPDTPYHRWLYDEATALHTYVSHSARNLSSVGRRTLRPTNYAVVENGVDLERFAPRPPDPELAARLGRREGEVVFGSCAGLGGYKRVDLMLRAAARLQGRYPFRVVALGGEDGGRRYTALARELGVGERFVYGGFHQDVRPWCSLFDVGFILSDAIETISFAAREMLATGIPLISSTYAGLVENVEEGYNGLLVRPGRVEDVEGAMVAFLEMSPQRRREMGRNARAKAERSFDRGRHLARLGAVYRSVLS